MSGNRLCGVVCVLALMLVAAAPQPPHPAEHHEFAIDNFRTESGVTLPKARIVYGTYGRLNAARDNAVLLPSHYMATHHGYDWLIGPDRALDPSKLFLIATELFGNGHSSSPSNTPEPFHGPRFPVTTIRDNVEAVHRLLVDDLKVTHLRAVIGFSMGAEQAFQWAVSYPGFADRIVATSGTAKAWPHGIVRLEGQIAALTADPAFNGGDYSSSPRKGIEAYGMVWLGWLYSQEWWRREMWKTNAPDRTLEQEIENRRRTFFANNDANDLILQARTWQRHDVGTTPGFNGDVQRALGSIAVPVLYMPSETDLYFPVSDAQFEAQFIPRVSLVPIPSLWGHPAGAGGNPTDRAFLNETIGRFLDTVSASASAVRYEEVRDWPKLPANVQFGEVSGVDVDANGHVMVFHRPGRGFEPAATTLLTEPAVAEIDADSGKLVASWGANMFLVPHGITVDAANNVFLTDVGLQQVFKFSHDGRRLLTVGEARVGAWDGTHFNQPTDIAIRDDGSFYVSDGYVNSRVALFDRNGRFLQEWGKKGAGPGEFSNPHGLAFEPNGDVLVADRENSRIQVFDPSGRFKREWLGAKETGRVFAVAVDAAGARYVGVRRPDYEPTNTGVLKLDRDWRTIASIGFGAPGDPVFNAVHDLAIGRDGSIYVAETRTKRVVKLRPVAT